MNLVFLIFFIFFTSSILRSEYKNQLWHGGPNVGVVVKLINDKRLAQRDSTQLNKVQRAFPRITGKCGGKDYVRILWYFAVKMIKGEPREIRTLVPGLLPWEAYGVYPILLRPKAGRISRLPYGPAMIAYDSIVDPLMSSATISNRVVWIWSKPKTEGLFASTIQTTLWARNEVNSCVMKESDIIFFI